MKATCPHLPGYAPLSAEQLRDPYPMWAKARAECPVFYDDALGVWSVTQFEDVLTVLREPATFSSAAAFALHHPTFPPKLEDRIPPHLFRPPMLVAKDPPAHTRLRKLMQKASTPTRVSALEPFITLTAHELVDAFALDGNADLMAQYANALHLRVIAHILGFAPERASALRQWTEDFLVLATPAGEGEDEQSADAKTATRMQRMLATMDEALTLVQQRRLVPADDAISALVAAADSDDLARDGQDLVILALELVIAGNDTTANLITHMIGYLLEDRSRWDELREDRSLVPGAVEETLRRRGSSKGLFRRATRNVEMGQARIGEGEIVHVLFASANHDEAKFPDPRRYDLHRDNASDHIGFERWTHFCLGAPLARLEAGVALEVLLDRLPDLRVRPGQAPGYAPTLTTQTLLRFDVEWIPDKENARAG